MKNLLMSLINKITNIPNKIYPVGSIYMSVNNTSPALLFGGEWERIQDRFLLAAGSSYNAGSTGGEPTHKLSVDEIPSHTHTFSGSTNSTGAHTHSVSGTAASAGSHTHQWKGYMTSSPYGSGAYKVPINGNDTWSPNMVSGGSHTHSVSGTAASAGGHSHSISASISNTGSSSAHNNMPPYLTVYIWKRIS